MADAVDEKAVDGGVEGALELADGAGELDGGAAPGDFVDGKSVAGEPGLDGLEVGVADAEARAEFVRAQEFAIAGRVDVLDGLEVGLEVGFLLGAAGEDEQHAGGGQGGGRGALVEFGLGELGLHERGGVAAESD